MATYEEYLKHYFNFDTFRKGQKEVIEILLRKESALAVFPTGSGKSLCFQYTAIFQENLTVVISPLIALMNDQLEFLEKHNIPAAKLDSTLSWDEVKKVYDDLRSNKLKVLYLAPERLSNERFTNVLSQVTIDLMVIDEAHCISEWGHNFRPDYMKLAQVAKRFDIKKVLALTATATPAVANDICNSFDIPQANYVNTGFYRKNLELRYVQSATCAKKEYLLNKIQGGNGGATIIYVTLQKTAEEVAIFLNNANIQAKPYHAGLKDDERVNIQNWFMNSPNSIIVATIAFGMGIDKGDIRFVYHYNLPKSLENYVQEIGRAGRDGKHSVCETLIDYSDIVTLKNFTYGDTPDSNDIANLTNFVFSQNNTFDVSLYDLSKQFDIKALVLKTYFIYLELNGILEVGTPFYATYKIKNKVPRQEMFSKFDNQRANFLQQVFSLGKQGPSWLSIDTVAVASRMNEDRMRIVRAISYLEEQGFIEAQVAGVRNVYYFKNRTAQLANLIQDLQNKFAERECKEIKMVDNYIDLLNHKSCKTQYIMNYFGEKIDLCGHCEYCINGTGNFATYADSTNRKFNNDEIAMVIQQIKLEYPTIFTSPRKIARFLCGLSSPAVSSTRISYIDNFGKERKHSLIHHKNYGMLASIPFNEVIKI